MSRPEVVSESEFNGRTNIAESAPLGPSNTRFEQNVWPPAAQRARMVVVLKLVIAFLILILYQSTEKRKPSSHRGVRTNPIVLVVASSGLRFGLPSEVLKIVTPFPVFG